MQLQEFVSQTLVQIVRGTLEAHNDVFRLGARVNPPLEKKDDHPGYVSGRGPSPLESTIFVDFDVVVLASEDSASKGGLGLFVAAFGAGASSQSGSSSTEQNRIRFCIPLMMPTGWQKPHDLQQSVASTV